MKIRNAFAAAATLAVTVAAAGIATGTAHAQTAQTQTAQDMAPARVVPIQVNGDPAKQFSLVIMGDGFTKRDMPTFRADLEKHLNILWSLEPFRSYRNYINVYAVEIESPESGITCDPAHRQQRKTALGLYFDGGCTNPNARGILARAEDARRYARMATSDFDQILVIANTDTYGGIGGSIATTSGGNSLSPYITPHEIGHSLGKLQDEYTYYQRGVKGAPYKTEQGEPSSIHHTLMTEDEMKTQQKKWWRWLGEPSESGGTIGRYEGGMYSVSGVWRPSRHSMMISLGYYFDQVSLEQLTQRISRQVQLISAGTPTDSVLPRDATVWIETAHPVYASLTTQWTLDGNALDQSDNARTIDLTTLPLTDGAHTLTVKAVDPTPFVRDPLIRDTAFTATRTWKIGTATRTGARSAIPAIIAATSNTRPVGGTDVVFIETTHPPFTTFDVAWILDGVALPNPANRTDLDLSTLNMKRGTHSLRATVSRMSSVADSRAWTIDNTLPTAQYKLMGDTSSITTPDGSLHYFVRDSFDMKIVPHDDQPGYLVSEFRLNGDGWHHYYGWPDAPPGAPFHFTPRGTLIKELVYGSLSAEGLSPQPWEERKPGYGDHVIEYRARDAAGNIGEAQHFGVTVAKSAPCSLVIDKPVTQNLDVRGGNVCIRNTTVTGNVNVYDGAALTVTRSRITGALTATNAAAIELVNTTVNDKADIRGTNSTLTIFGATFGTSLELHANTARAVILAGNTVTTAFVCDGMAATPRTFGAPQATVNSAPKECTR